MMDPAVAIEATSQRRFVMEQSHSENLQLERLGAGALSKIERLGYNRKSRYRYRTTWEHLIEFSRREELGDEFSADLAARFLEECRVRDGQPAGPSDGWRRHVVRELEVLAEVAENGRSGRTR